MDYLLLETRNAVWGAWILLDLPASANELLRAFANRLTRRAVASDTARARVGNETRRVDFHLAGDTHDPRILVQ